MVDYVPDEIKVPKTARIFSIPKLHIFDKHNYQGAPWGCLFGLRHLTWDASTDLKKTFYPGFT